jgi:hypothetical protein
MDFQQQQENTDFADKKDIYAKMPVRRHLRAAVAFIYDR